MPPNDSGADEHCSNEGGKLKAFPCKTFPHMRHIVAVVRGSRIHLSGSRPMLRSLLHSSKSGLVDF